MANVKETVLAKHKTNKDIEPREFRKVEWDKGGSWQKDWELVNEKKTTAKASKPKATEPTAEDVATIEALKSEYKSLQPEGKNVPNNKVKDVEWIKEQIEGFKLAIAEASEEE